MGTEWITGNTNLVASASEDTSGDFVNFQISLETPQPFNEVSDHAQDSTSIFAHQNVSPLSASVHTVLRCVSSRCVLYKGVNIKYQVGTDNDVRSFATNSSGLQDTIDPNVSAHPINS